MGRQAAAPAGGQRPDAHRQAQARRGGFVYVVYVCALWGGCAKAADQFTMLMVCMPVTGPPRAPLRERRMGAELH